jgi:glycerol-3-phosphate dehydrogenase
MSYERDLSIIGELTEEVRSKRNKLALRIDARVVQETPKDTSEAAGAWIVSDGRPNDADIKTKNPSAAISQGAAAIKGAKVFTELFIQNTKPYIERLNEGWSLQAPSKYIDRIIEQEVARNE